MKKYIHIGYPKNLSTTLQRDFFPNHPDIFHLGVGIGSNIDYKDDFINIIFEDYLLYCRKHRYATVREKAKEHLLQWYNKAKSEGYQAVGISAELLSFAFTPDHIDTVEKANRLRYLFGNNTEIIIIIRHQWDLLKSLYREAIKIGYPSTFREFIEYVYYYQDRSFLYDFLYEHNIKTYQKLFGQKNVHIIPIESVREKSGQLIKSGNQVKLIKLLCEKLEIPYHKIKLSYHNKSLSEIELLNMMKKNQKLPHDLGNPIYSVVNGHRLAKYFSKDLKVPMPEKTKNDVLLKRDILYSLRNEKCNKTGIDYYVDPYIARELDKLFITSNNNLTKIIGNTILPDSYLKINYYDSINGYDKS